MRGFDVMASMWGVDVTVLRGGGRDRLGDPRPVTRHHVGQCLLAPGEARESDEYDELPVTRARLFRANRDFDFERGDRVEVSGDPGVWDVDGVPAVWPVGVVVSLKRRG